MSHSDVFVIGAGPAGLTAAYLLTKSGVSTTVIEADPTYVGGISRTASYKDFLFDIGGHRFFSKSKEVVDLWKEILPDDFIERPRLSRIYYNGQLLLLPAQGLRGPEQPGLRGIGAVRAVVPAEAGLPHGQPRELPRLGRQPVRRAPVQHLLQDLHREGVGHELRRDLGRLGGAAHQGPRFVERDVERAAQLAAARRRAEEGRPADQDADRVVPVSPQGPRHDVGRGGGQDQAARRPHPHGHAAREPALERAARPCGPSASSRPMGNGSRSRRATSSPRRRSASWCRASARSRPARRPPRACATATSSPWR